MNADVADWGLVATVLALADDPGVLVTGRAIAEALGIPAEYSAFIERRLQRDRELGLLDCDQHGNWQLTPAGLAAATTLTLTAQLVEPRQATAARSGGTGDTLLPVPTAPSPPQASSDRAGAAHVTVPGNDAA